MNIFNTLLQKLGLKYEDKEEEAEYNRVRLPIFKEFFNYFFCALILMLTPFAVRFWIRDVQPQKEIILGLMALGVLLLIVTKDIAKGKEYILLAFIMGIVALLLTVMRKLIPMASGRESFYMGYVLASVLRIVGYRVVKVSSVVILFVYSFCIKFPMIPNPEAALNVIVVTLDVVFIVIAYKGERVERLFFDALYKSKKSILKFKLLLSKYFPNQLAIFSSDYSTILFTNSAFKKMFKGKTIEETKDCLKRLVFEKETVEKNKTTFSNFGYEFSSEQESLNLSDFLTILSKKYDILKEIGTISFPVIEEASAEQVEVLKQEKEKEVQEETENQAKDTKDSKEDKKSGKKRSISYTNTNTNSRPPADPKNPYNIVEASNSQESNDKGGSSQGSDDGRSKAFKVKIFPIKWDESDALVLVMDDITQQRTIMELKVADKNKDLVIATVSHELRTPLNGMLGLVDIAMKNIKDANALSYLSACKNSGGLMLNLINSILDLQQIKDNKLKLVYTKIPLGQFFIDVKALFGQIMEVKNLYLNVEIGPNVPKTITTDKSRLTQILVNLLGNAFKFTFAGGVTVRVDVESTKPTVLKFSVRDTGIGIKKEDQERLFKMYGKLEQKDQKINTNGVGLGLTISANLVGLLNPGGKPIEVESQLDKGTCFSFYIQSQGSDKSSREDSKSRSFEDIGSYALNEDEDKTIVKKMSSYVTTNQENSSKLFFVPSSHLFSKPTLTNLPVVKEEAHSLLIKKNGTKSLVKNHDTHPASINELDYDRERRPLIPGRSSENISPTGTKEQKLKASWCLVVDDNPFNLMVASHIMEERGYRIKTALNGQEAIEKALEHQKNELTFQLVLMDCQMPVIDGYEATRILKKMMRNREIGDCPIVALTANNMNEMHERLCKDAGMDGHVSKPLQINDLEAMLKQIQTMKSQTSHKV